MSKEDKKTILVTGATGFIGRHLVEKLLSLDKYSIVCISRFPNKAKEFERKNVKLIKADITEEKDLEKLMSLPIKIIIHSAGCVDSKNPTVLNKINIEGTENICKLAVRLGVERLIYTSSVSVVSGNAQIPLTEDLPYSATNAYGQSKLEAERRVLVYRKKGLPVIVLRFPMIYGEDEPHLFLVLLKLLKYRLLPVFEGGKNRLHLVYIENVIDSIIFSLENDQMFEGSFFVADKEALTVEQVFKIMAQGIDGPTLLHIPHFLTPLFFHLPFIGKRLRFFQKDRLYSTERIESLGFNPPYRVKDALLKSSRARFEMQKR